MKLLRFFKERRQKLLSMCLLALASAHSSIARADIGGGITEATSTIKNYLPLVQKLCYSIASIVFIVGAISIFIKMSNDEQDVKKSMMMLVGGVLFLVIAGTVAPKLFA